jgi:dihydrofolate reductase
MRRIVEYTLVTLDGVIENPRGWGFMSFRDDAYQRDGLGLLLACDSLLLGRTTYESFAQIWPSRTDPWAVRLNAMPKYVVSSTLERAEWHNSTIVRGDVVAEVAKLKEQTGGDLLVMGHGLLAQTLLRERLLDVMDVSIHPVIVGQGKQLFREGEHASLRLVATKSFSKIVKLTYEPVYA